MRLVVFATSTVLLAVSGVAQQPWVDAPDRLAETKAFLAARSQAWRSSLPATFRFQEWDSGPRDAVSWSGVFDRGRLNASFLKFPTALEDAAAARGVAGLRAWLLFDGSGWLVVERPLGDEPDQPWSALQAKDCPAPQWRSTIVFSMAAPLMNRSVPDFLEHYPMLRMRETAEGMEVDFAATAGVAEIVANPKLGKVWGCLGFRVTFGAASDWQPIRASELHDQVPAFDQPGFEHLERLDLAGLPVVVQKQWTWSEWRALGRARVPTVFVEQHAFGFESEQFAPSRVVYRSKVECEALDAAPAGVTFALVAPESAGPTGRISDMDTGAVKVVDLRGVRARTASSEAFVRGVLDVAGRDAAPARTNWAAIGGAVLLFAGAVGGGLLLIRNCRKSPRRAACAAS